MTKIMAIINVTPDSFSDGGCFQSPAAVVEQAQKLKAAGADILDIGAESTRPGATAVSAEEELTRLEPAVCALLQAGLGPLSIDTYKAEVAAKMLALGASIINDVKGIHVDEKMAAAICDYRAHWILMDDKPFTGITSAVNNMARAVKRARELGVAEEQLLIDPGLGFNKNRMDNLLLTKNLASYRELGLPIVYGPSRKRFLGEITGREVTDRDRATAAVCCWAVTQGADIVRVHDVDALVDAVKIGQAIFDAQ